MSAKLGLLKRLRHSRKLVRDAASSVTSLAEADRMRADDVRAGAEEDLETLQRGAGPRFLAANSVSDLLRVEEERLLAVDRVDVARTSLDEKTAAAERCRADLNLKARALRVSEKLIEWAKADLALREKRSEQSLADDLSGARRKDVA